MIGSDIVSVSNLKLWTTSSKLIQLQQFTWDKIYSTQCSLEVGNQSYIEVCELKNCKQNWIAFKITIKPNYSLSFLGLKKTK